MASIKCNSCGYDNPPEARFCANCGSNLVTTIGQPAPMAAPSARPATPEVAAEYMGFWIRFGAAIIDTIVVWLISFVLSYFPLVHIFGYRFAFVPSIFWFPIAWLYYWLFTGLKGQTLGKMAVSIKVVDARGDKLGLGIAAMREVLGKTISAVVFCLGFLWIIWDGRKQGWHDKIAKTYVVRVELRR